MLQSAAVPRLAWVMSRRAVASADSTGSPAANAVKRARLKSTAARSSTGTCMPTTTGTPWVSRAWAVLRRKWVAEAVSHALSTTRLSDRGDHHLAEVFGRHRV